VDLLSSPGTLYRYTAIERQLKKHIRTFNTSYTFYCIVQSHAVQSREVAKLIAKTQNDPPIHSAKRPRNRTGMVWNVYNASQYFASEPSFFEAGSGRMSHSQIIWRSEVESSVIQSRRRPLSELNTTMTGRVQDKATTIAHPSLQNQ
jgi:hypothetical protein